MDSIGIDDNAILGRLAPCFRFDNQDAFRADDNVVDVTENLLTIAHENVMEHSPLKGEKFFFEKLADGCFAFHGHLDTAHLGQSAPDTNGCVTSEQDGADAQAEWRNGCFRIPPPPLYRGQYDKNQCNKKRSEELPHQHFVKLLA